MKIEAIYTLWEQDSTIIADQLDEESLKISKLHHKYFKLFGIERLTLKKLEAEYKKLKHEKYEFYTQGPNDEQQRKGWVLPPKGVILKNEVDRYLEADNELVDFGLKLEVQKEKVELLQSIIHNINQRSFNIKNAIEFIKFSQGI